MDVQAELKQFKGRVDPKIAAFFERVIAEAESEDMLIREALGHSRELALAGGKRLRAAFMYYGYLAAGGTEEESIIETSVSIEILHLFLLVHDDIIDRDDVRHNVPTLHRRYADYGRRVFGKGVDAEHFGLSIALIMGDMLSAFGNDIIFRSPFPQERIFRALSNLQKIVSLTAVGQARDVYMEYRGEASEEEILKMYENKTARYTVEGPLHIGATLAGADGEFLDILSRYALPLGIAFQMRDDILGVYGAADRLGKPVGSDIEEGKITLLVSRALSMGAPTEQRELMAILGLGTKLTEDNIERFREIIRETGALRSVEALSEKLIAEGCDALADAPASFHPKAKEFLLAVAEYLSKREY